MLGRSPLSTTPLCVVEIVDNGDVLQFTVQDFSAPAYTSIDRSRGGGAVPLLPEPFEIASQARYLVEDASGPSVMTH